MKITKDNLIKIQDAPIELFYQGMKAEDTKSSYTRRLKLVLCDYLESVLEGSFENRASQLVYKAKENPQEVLSILLTLAKMLRARTKKDPSDKDYLNPSSFNNYFKPLKKLFDMNGVGLAWKRIYATYPEQDNLDSSRGYTRQEIQTMLEFALGAIDKAIILIASSSGVRVGGLEGLKWEDITPVYKIDEKLALEVTESEVLRSEVVCAILTVYKHTKDEYPAFITSEAYNALQNYRTSWINEIGREPKPYDPLFKEAGLFVKPLRESGIRKRIFRIILKSGLRSKIVKARRHNVPAMNGFRRFFNKTFKESISKDSPLASLIKKEYAMGHIGLVHLDRNYFKTNVIELVEEYLNAVSNLTISDESRIRIQNVKYEKRLSEVEVSREEFDELKREMRLIKKYAKLNPKNL